MIHKLILTLAFICLTLAFPAQEVIGAYNLGDPATWMGIAAIIVILQLTFVSLAYMAAGIFQDEELKAWCKNEVVQAVYSLIILASIVAVLATANGIADSFFVGLIDPTAQCTTDECRHTLRTDLTYNPSTNRWKEGGSGLKVTVKDGTPACSWSGTGPSPPCDPKFLMARSYLGITYEKLSTVLGNLMYSYAVYNSIDSMGFSNAFFILDKKFGLSFSAGYPTHSVLLTSLNHMIGFTEKMMMLIKFQESILKYFEFGMAGGLIVLGIFFRSIWVFRKAGGLFLAMGLGFMFVLPLLYALGWYTIDIPPMREAGISAPGDVNIAGGDAPSGISGFFDQVSGLLTMFTSGDASTLVSAWAILASLMAWISLRIVELANPITTVLGHILLALDAIIVISVIMALISLSGVPIKDSTQLYTDYKEKTIGYFDLLSRYALVAVAIPLLNFYILFSFIRGLSPLLGGEQDIPALSRLL